MPQGPPVPGRVPETPPHAPPVFVPPQHQPPPAATRRTDLASRDFDCSVTMLEVRPRMCAVTFCGGQMIPILLEEVSGVICYLQFHIPLIVVVGQVIVKERLTRANLRQHAREIVRLILFESPASSIEH